jgi:hypothetical protein
LALVAGVARNGNSGAMDCCPVAEYSASHRALSLAS